MPISAKNKSQRGESGLDETSLDELPQTSSSEMSDQNQELADTAPQAVVAADVSGKVEETLNSSPYSATDLRLATRMNREIAQHLGLTGKSRSVKL
jgi:cellobiose phosphorylase